MPNLPPPDGPGWGWNNGGGGGRGRGNSPSKPQGTVIRTWGGAFAQDSAYIGFVEGYNNEGDAKKGTIKKCASNSKGDQNCQVILTFYNRCTVYADSKDYWSEVSDPSMDKANKKALKECENNTTSPEAQCEVKVAGCTKSFFMHPDGRLEDY